MIFIRGTYKNHIYDDNFKGKFENGGLPQHVDLPRLDEGMQGGAFWSAFMPCPSGNGTDFSNERYSESEIMLRQMRSNSHD
jgi:membrane dipeptidase